MSRSLRRGATAALILAAIVPLSACAAGTTPATLQVQPNSVATSIGNDLKLNAITVVTPGDATSDKAGPVTVSLNISNTGRDAQTLKSVTVGDATATFTDAKGGMIPEIVVPAGGAVLVGGPGNPIAQVKSVKVTIGGFAPTSFTFANAGKVGANASVRPAVGELASYGPSVPAGASPSVSASASASASATPSASASASAGVSPSASVSPAAAASASASPAH